MYIAFNHPPFSGLSPAYAYFIMTSSTHFIAAIMVGNPAVVKAINTACRSSSAEVPSAKARPACDLNPPELKPMAMPNFISRRVFSPSGQLLNLSNSTKKGTLNRHQTVVPVPLLTPIYSTSTFRVRISVSYTNSLLLLMPNVNAPWCGGEW